MSTRGHDVCEQCHMTIIDFRTVKLNNCSQFFQECGTSCFDTEYLQDFDERVRVRSNWIDVFNCQSLSKVNAVRFQLPLISNVITSILFLICSPTLHHEYSC